MSHAMNVQDRTGHTKITWDPDDPDSVKEARKSFNLLKEKGYAFFEQKGPKGSEDSDEKGKSLTKFDPKAREILAVPPLAGG